MTEASLAHHTVATLLATRQLSYKVTWGMLKDAYKKFGAFAMFMLSLLALCVALCGGAHVCQFVQICRPRGVCQGEDNR